MHKIRVALEGNILRTINIYAKIESYFAKLFWKISDDWRKKLQSLTEKRKFWENCMREELSEENLTTEFKIGSYGLSGIIKENRGVNFYLRKKYNNCCLLLTEMEAIKNSLQFPDR